VGLGNELGAAALDEVARFGDDVFQYFDQFPDAGFAMYKVRSSFAEGWIALDFLGGEYSAVGGFCMSSGGCHIENVALV
jgi:hypothetical protein